MTTTASPPSRLGPQGTTPTAPTAHIPLAARTPPPNPALPPPGWSFRELGQYRALESRQRLDSWAVDLHVLHQADANADPIGPAIRQQVDAVRNRLGQHVAKLASALPAGKQYHAALEELRTHEKAAQESGRQLARLQAMRTVEQLAERPKAEELAELDGKIAEAQAAHRKADSLAATMRPLVEERRKAVQAEMGQLADRELAGMLDELTAARVKALQAVLAVCGDSIRDLVIADQVYSGAMIGTREFATAAAMTALATPPPQQT